MSGEWTDQMAGARMQVDQQFSQRVLDSPFTNQQWGLVMTAVEFVIENPENPDQAELRADTEQVPQILPHLDELPQGGMGGQPTADRSGRGFGGILDSFRGLLGGDKGPSDEERLQEATALVEDYTDQLEAHLRERGRWETLCASAAASEQ